MRTIQDRKQHNGDESGPQDERREDASGKCPGDCIGEGRKVHGWRKEERVATQADRQLTVTLNGLAAVAGRRRKSHVCLVRIHI